MIADGQTGRTNNVMFTVAGATTIRTSLYVQGMGAGASTDQILHGVTGGLDDL